MHLQRDDDLIISDDPARLDVDRISAWLAASYWAGNRDRATVVRSLDGSMTYGVYDGAGRQVAVTRVVTDRATFAWLCDVVVDEAWRGRGIGRWLVRTVVANLRDLGVQRIVLTTRDAHGVYQGVGFDALRAPRTWMEIDVRATRPEPDGVLGGVP
jgi:GNAT superfamily N-acetyltransferase